MLRSSATGIRRILEYKYGSAMRQRNLLIGVSQVWATILVTSSISPNTAPTMAWVSTSIRHRPPPRWSTSKSQPATLKSSSNKAQRQNPTTICRSNTAGDSDRTVDESGEPKFRRGDEIQVEVTNFGYLGASVDVIGLGHGEDVPLLPPDSVPYATGIIAQKEIAYYRQARRNVDVVRGEVLPAYVQNVREEDGKLDVGLRKFGGKAKSTEVETLILDRLNESADGWLPIGEKSPPAEISREFPGVSKVVFKNALGGLYKKGLVKPGPDGIELMKK